MAAVFSQIPQEIIDNIIDGLSCDASSLHTCSTTYRKFTRRCQYHLFFRVWLVFPKDRSDPAENTQHLIRLLRADLARNIRHLRIDYYVENRPGTATDGGLPHVLQKLVSLTSFSFALAYQTQLSSTLISCLIDTCRSTQVIDITLHNIIDFPAPLLAYHCPTIRYLNFEYCRPCLDVPQPQFPLPLQFDSLPRSQEARFLELLILRGDALQCTKDFCAANEHLKCSVLYLSRLQVISVIGSSPRLLIFAADCMRAAGDSLKELCWDVSCNSDSYELTLTNTASLTEKFGLPKSVESLQIAFPWLTRRANIVLRWLATALEHHSGPSQLQELILVMDTTWIPEFYHECDSDALNTADNVLAGGQFPHFEQAFVFIECAAGVKVGDKVIRGKINSVKAAFPRLHRRKMLRVQWLEMEETGQSGMTVALRALNEGITRRDIHMAENEQFVPVCHVMKPRRKRVEGREDSS